MTTPETTFDATFIFEFVKGDDELGFLSGMYSYHDNGFEDRVFTFEYTFPSDHKIKFGTCKWETANDFDLVSSISTLYRTGC